MLNASKHSVQRKETFLFMYGRNFFEPITEQVVLEEVFINKQNQHCAKSLVDIVTSV